MEIFEEDKRCVPVTGNVEFDEVDVDDDSITTEGDVVDEDERDISSALVPDPKRYIFPRHLIVDGPVNALK